MVWNRYIKEASFESKQLYCCTVWNLCILQHTNITSSKKTTYFIGFKILFKLFINFSKWSLNMYKFWFKRRLSIHKKNVCIKELPKKKVRRKYMWMRVHCVIFGFFLTLDCTNTGMITLYISVFACFCI